MLSSCSSDRSTAPWRKAAWIAAAVVICACVAGFVRRRMTVCTNPPGALVYVDDYEICTTPISHNFTYYGK